MKTIEQDKFQIRSEERGENLYLYQDCIHGEGHDCIEVEKKGASELIKVLQEWVDKE